MRFRNRVYRRRNVRSGLSHSYTALTYPSISDLFRPGTTHIPVAVYSLSFLVGPCIGALVGGFIAQNVTWRVNFYLMIGWSSSQLALLFFVPETFLPIIVKREARQKRLETGIALWHAPSDESDRRFSDVFLSAVWVPMKMMLVERMLLAMDLWTMSLLSIVYLFFNAIPSTMLTVYGL